MTAVAVPTQKTVLAYVQSYLNDAESDKVDSITDTEESIQVANLLRDTYYEWLEVEEFSWLEKGIKPTSVADADYPTSFNLPDDVSKIEGIRFLKYNIDETGTNTTFKELTWRDPVEFLRGQPNGLTSQTQLVTVDNQPFYVWTNRHPTYWTALTPSIIVCDAFKSTVDTYLTTAKLHGRALYRPTFTLEDDFTPTLPLDLEPSLQARLNAAAFNHFKQTQSGPDERKQQRQAALSINKDKRVKRTNEYRQNQFGRRR